MHLSEWAGLTNSWYIPPIRIAGRPGIAYQNGASDADVWTRMHRLFLGRIRPLLAYFAEFCHNE